MSIVSDVLASVEQAENWHRFMRRYQRAVPLTDGDLWVLKVGLTALQPANIEESALVYVSPEMCTLLRHASLSLPPYVFEPSVLPWPAAFCVFGESIQSDDVALKAIVWGPWAKGRGSHLHAGLVRSAHKPWLFPVIGGSLTPGHQINDFDHVGLDHDWDDTARLLCTLWLLIQQRVTVQRVGAADRAGRRRWGRDHEGPVPETIVIELRRPAQTTPHDDTLTGFVDWSHRWIVDGHWRNQYHPSTATHVPTWIAPHIKGPEDKPLVVKRKVNAWVR